MSSNEDSTCPDGGQKGGTVPGVMCVAFVPLLRFVVVVDDFVFFGWRGTPHVTM